MKPQSLFFLLIFVILSIHSVSALCSPGQRHCEDPNERNVNSNGNGVDTEGDYGEAGTPGTPPPDGTQPPDDGESGVDKPVDGDNIGGGTPSDQSSSNGLGKGAITALSLGGGLLLVAAAIFKIRKKRDVDTDETNTGMDFDTSAAPSMGDDTA